MLLNILVKLLVVMICFTAESDNAEDWIRPYSKNPHYWQYKGHPVLLLGGTRNDNLFQISDLRQHLSMLHQVGGNYIRNTMSSRDSMDLYPFKRLPDGKYDLERWDDRYWTRFENLLRWCHERDIIIQIEVWDRFDFSQQYWQKSAWNPMNNINYSVATSGMETVYPEHPHLDLQPFFHSIPGMPDYRPILDKVREYQQAFVNKLLSHSLQYGNVLYCMDNETSTPAAWGQYWIRLIKTIAGNRGKQVYLTDMFDSFYKPQACHLCQDLIRQPEIYTFIDISQINSRNFGQQHWDTLQWILNYTKQYPRPVNHTKVYGGGSSSWGSGTNQDGLERFCRNILGGSASARFHRPNSGSGLNPLSQAAIRSFRKAEEHIKLWNIDPRQELLSERQDNEAYLAASEEMRQYLLYFTDGGSVRLRLNGTGVMSLQWIDLSIGEWGNQTTVEAGDNPRIDAPGPGGWLAIVYRQQ